MSEKKSYHLSHARCFQGFWLGSVRNVLSLFSVEILYCYFGVVKNLHELQCSSFPPRDATRCRQLFFSPPPSIIWLPAFVKCGVSYVVQSTCIVIYSKLLSNYLTKNGRCCSRNQVSYLQNNSLCYFSRLYCTLFLFGGFLNVIKMASELCEINVLSVTLVSPDLCILCSVFDTLYETSTVQFG